MKSFLTVQLFLILNSSFAQDITKINYFFGYGIYDGVNVGMEYQLKNKKQTISSFLGYERLFTRKQQSFILGLGLHNAVFTNSKNELEQYKWQINSKITFWQLEGDFYLWRFISYSPSISYKFIILKKHNIVVDFGPIFNIVVHSKRKTFEEIGWPHKVMPNFRVIFVL